MPAELFPANPIFNVATLLPPDRKRRNAYIQNWNLQVSRQIGANDVLEVGWVGSKGTFIDTSLNHFNNPAPSLLPFPSRAAPFRCTTVSA